MYSLVMMAALATGADATPAPVVAAPVVLTSCGGCCGYVTSCTGCTGCYGGCYGGCHGWGHGRKWHGHKHGCISYGCCGFNWGPVCGGYGSCCGYSYSCIGYGGGCCGGYGVYNYGGCGSLPAYGMYNIGGGGVIVAPAGVAPAVTTPATPVPPAITPKTSANIKFVLPADAKLYVDGRLTNGAGEERPFYTPSLTPGRKFYYEAKAEMVINGETIVEEKRVIVQAGDDLNESFPKLIAAAAKKPEAVATK